MQCVGEGTRLLMKMLTKYVRVLYSVENVSNLKHLRLFTLERDYFPLNTRALLSKNVILKFEIFNKGFTCGGN
jgi:hypothetical protein